MSTNLFLILETFTQGHSTIALAILSLISVIFAILVITTKNPVLSVLFLIGLYATMASYLIAIGISFIGISYLLVYVGAISILFLFILMLLNIRTSELFSDTKNSIPLVIIVTISLTIVLKSILYFSDAEAITQMLFLCTWDTEAQATTHITAIGNILYTNYFSWLIITSIILLLAMVGAIIITIKPKKDLEQGQANTLENNVIKSLTTFFY